jgi:hypothetical protein
MARPIGTNRAFISAAAVTASAPPPPPARTVAAANCAEPENASIDATIGAHGPQPPVTASAPNVIPSGSVAAAGPKPTRIPARNLTRLSSTPAG